MRKFTLFLMTLILFNLSFAAGETFTFQGFVPSAATSIVKSSHRIKALGSSRISYPMFISSKNSNIVKNMNKNMEKFILDYKSTKDRFYVITSEIKADNSLFLSVLFTIEEKNTKTGQKTKLYDGITFNLKDGSTLRLKDLFTSDFNAPLSTAVNDRFRQFGLLPVDKFTAISKNQSFYMENDAVVLIYNKGEGTDFANGEVFIPFMLRDLVEILK